MKDAPFLYPVGWNRVYGLKNGDYVLCVPTDRYTCEGVYLLRDRQFEALWVCSTNFNVKNPRIRIWQHNPNDAQLLTREEFNSILVAQVAATVNMTAPHLLENIDPAYRRDPKRQMIDMLPLITEHPAIPRHRGETLIDRTAPGR